MTRAEFLSELDRRLSPLPKKQSYDYLVYYAEMMTDRMEDGMTEEEAVESMERVDVIARRILGEVYTTPQPAKKNTEGKWLGITALSICAVAVVAVCALVGLSLPFAGSVMVRSDTVVVEQETTAALPDDFDEPIVNVDENCTLFDTYGIHTLDIAWANGSVVFEVWDEDEIGIFEYGSQTMQWTKADGTLKIEYMDEDTDSLSICLPSAFAQRKLEEIRIGVESADVMLYGVNATSLQATTVSGYLDINGYFDTATISTISGGVTLSGSINDVIFDSVSGAVLFDFDSTLRSLRAESISGYMTITIPEDLGFDLQFSGVSSTLYSGWLDIAAEKEFQTSYGDGEADLYLTSTCGEVFLEQG